METKLETIFDIHTLTDRKNITNKCDVRMPIEEIEQIEKEGLTSELIEASKYKIFKYQTQVTVHCIPDRKIEERILNYKYIANNKNKSLGVRYDCIDANKKRTITNAVNACKAKFISNKYGCLFQSTAIQNVEEAYVIAEEFKKLVELIKSKVDFVGNYSCFISNIYGQLFACCEIKVNAIYQKDLWKFLSLVTKFQTEEEYLKFVEEKENKRNAEMQELRDKQKEGYEKALIVQQNKIDADESQTLDLTKPVDFIGYRYLIDFSNEVTKQYVQGYWDKNNKYIIQYKNERDRKDIINKRQKDNKLRMDKLIANKRTIFIIETF